MSGPGRLTRAQAQQHGYQNTMLVHPRPADGMERSEPSLVPEWLKGASSGSGATHHSQPPSHQDESGSSFPSRQRSQPHSAVTGGHGDYDSPRYSGSSDRSFYSAVRRGGSNSGGATERSIYERDSFTHTRPYSSFGRSPLYRTYDGLERDREGQRERDWDWDRDRDRDFRDRDRALGFGGGDDRERDRERSDATFRRPTTSASAGRYDSDLALRRSQSLGSNRGSENGEKKSVGELGGILTAGLPTAPPVSGVSLTSSIQKAAFERNFPSLGAQERQGAIQSSLGNLSALSPRPSWQGSTPRPDGRAATPSPGLQSTQIATPGSFSAGGGGSVGADGWSSALAEASPLLSSAVPANNGVVGGMVVSTMISSTTSPVPGHLASSLGTPKMVEALAQNPSRGRATPQFAVENQTQRLEELQFKQSRQLVPIKPSLPKNMGVSPRDKAKPKAVRAVDVIAPAATKLSQPLGSSQLLSAPYRPPAPISRTETLKPIPSGKLLVRRTRKEVSSSSALLPVSVKSDGSSPVNAPTVGTVVSSTGGAASGALASIAIAAAPRKQKQLLDRRAVPIAPISITSGSDGGNGVKAKDGSDDKRPQLQAQNRSDFFNALRKKAAGVVSVSGNNEKTEVTLVKCEDISEKDLRDTLRNNFSRGPPQLAGFDANGVVLQSSSLVDTISAAKNHFLNVDLGKENSVSGLTVDGINVLSEDSSDLSGPSATRQGDSLVGGSEEEEAAFLRSLGWEESAEGGEEALTEEEINAFYQEHMRSMSDKPSLRNHGNLRLKPLDLYVGSIGSISSGPSISDSESDDDVQTHC